MDVCYVFFILEVWDLMNFPVVCCSHVDFHLEKMAWLIMFLCSDVCGRVLSMVGCCLWLGVVCGRVLSVVGCCLW